MPQQVQKPKVNQKREQKQVDSLPSAPDKSELKGELDNLLDEIDEVLEENAAEFVAAYVQKGGQ